MQPVKKEKFKVYKLLLFLILITFSNHFASQDRMLKFNHLYLVLDSATFNKIKNHPELISLGNFDKGLPDFEKIDSSATTLYLRGKTTYIEIMGPKNKFNEKVGAVGLGFSWDTTKLENNNLELKLKETCHVKFTSYESKWPFDEEKVLWYTANYTDIQGHVATWFAYYNPYFLSKLFKEEHSTFNRELSLNKAYKSDPLITDLAEIILDCSAEDFTKIINELDCFFTDKKEVEPEVTTFIVDNVKIKLKKSSKKITKITSLIFKSNHKKNTLNFDFGSLKLVYKQNEILFQF